MKKTFVFIVFILMSNIAVSAPFYQKLEQKRYSFSALNSLMAFVEKKSPGENERKALGQLSWEVGIEILEDYDSKILEQFATPPAWFALARKSLKNSDYNSVLNYSDKIPKNHWLFPEAKLMQSEVYLIKKNTEEELKALKICSKSASSAKSDDRYFKVVGEICLANIARYYFNKGKYKEALDEFNRFPKNSYLWPSLLFERAWLNYHLKDYNRTLGLLVTYKSPLLDTYFFPEAEYLSALSYFRLCLWEDTTILVNQYYKVYRPRFYELEKILRENVNKPQYFYQMMLRLDQGLKGQEIFIGKIIGRIKKEQRFISGFRQIAEIDKEINRISKAEKPDIQNKVVPHLNLVRSNIIAKLDNYAKLTIFNFLNRVKFFSNEMFKLHLEISLRKKDLIYDNKKLISDRSRGDYSNVKRTRFEYFWKFEGAFWADELGDYSFGLKSNCETVNREVTK